MPISLHGREDGLSTTDQDEQHPQLHSRGGEGLETLIVLLLSPLLSRRGYGSRIIETLAIARLLMLALFRLCVFCVASSCCVVCPVFVNAR